MLDNYQTMFYNEFVHRTCSLKNNWRSIHEKNEKSIKHHPGCCYGI